ncbi:MAG TPA: acyl-CoA dehydrogenase family protein [Thermoanaerobaculia bacterium]|jgi:acyl-CoA dehydrogenase|nr:acyl-CoA dehydrogenase family protein [Thermoanaerobaculia bacterium]
MTPDPAPVRAFLEPRHFELAAEVAAFAIAEIASLPAPVDDSTARTQAREILARIGAGGWTRWAIPESFGGRAEAPDLRACCIIREALAAASPLADAVFALQCLGSMPITLGGSDAQRAAWLPRVARGKAMTAFAMTEPEAGSDVSGLATTARRDGDGWRLDGRKTLISNAGIADVHCVFAATDRAAGNRGISCFLVPADTPGLRFAGAQVLSAPHPLGELVFDDCHLPADALLGDENAGFKLGMRTLDRLRPTVAAAACGMASRALDEALAHARTRKQFGEPLAAFQLVQSKLASMATELTAARLLVYRAAWEADRGAERITLEAAMAKAYATEAAQRIVDQAVQVIGGRGVLVDHPVDRLYRAVRALRIYEGTTEVQHLVIARQIVGKIE